MKIFKLRIKMIPFAGFFVIAGILGFLNHFRSIPLVDNYTDKGFTELLPAGVKAVRIEDVRKAIASSSHLVVDVRIKPLYDEEHIPTAVNVPEDTQYPDSVLYSVAQSATVESPLIIYCEGGTCQSSIYIAQKLQLAGFKDISVYLGGWSEWKETEGA